MITPELDARRRSWRMFFLFCIQSAEEFLKIPVLLVVPVKLAIVTAQHLLTKEPVLIRHREQTMKTAASQLPVN